MSPAEPPSATAEQALKIARQHQAAGRLADAESIYRSLLEADPDNADVLHLLGATALQLGNYDQAASRMERAVALSPGNPVFLNNLGEALRELNRPRAAEKHYRRALALKPDFVKAHNNLANALKAQGRYDEAAASYDAAMKLDPAFAHARVNYALFQLLRGDYASGFAFYEQRYEGTDLRHVNFARDMIGRMHGAPQWQGEPLAGQRLLVWTEQGLGDSVMMMRYLPLLKNRGAGRVIVYCSAPLVRLMRAVAGVDEVIAQEDSLAVGTFDRYCALMSLPHVFATTLDSVPPDVPYLRVPAELQCKWVARLAAIARPRVGLVWAGAKRNLTEARRSTRLQAFAPVLGAGGAHFVSLQKGAEARELETVKWPLFDAMDECGDLMETAALIGELDLVITIDTSVAHLAGALGRPVWLLTRGDSAWQWLLERETSPWYPTMRIFRQPPGGNWHDLMVRVAAAFRTAFGGGAGEPATRGHARVQ